VPQYDVRYVESSRLQLRRVEAVNAQAVGQVLGVAPALIASVHPVGHRADVAWRGRVSPRFPVRLFGHELSVLLGAGIALLEALQTLREKETSGFVAKALDSVISSLRQGQPLSAALATQPQAFDALFIAIVSSAERTGQLQQALREHAAYLAWTEQLRAKLVGALVYPALLMAASAAVVLFLLMFVVPRFATVLDGAATDGVPWASRALLQAGLWASQHSALTLLACGLVLSLPLLAWRHAGLRDNAQHLLWRLPVFGMRLRLLALTRLYRTTGMLLDAGVALVPALRTALAVTAPRLRAALQATIDAIARGERLSAALAQQGLATPVALRMVRVGEQTGALGTMLGEAARFHDDEMQRLTDLVGRLVNPVLMLMMGTIIGSIVVLLYLPIFQLAEQVQ
jgi:general secretion pathway protein F